MGVKMTSKLKCPVGRKPLEQVGTSRQYQCGTWGCDASFDMIGTEALWTALIQAKQDLEIATKALGYCIKMFKSLENVLDEKVEASDMPDNPDLYAWVVRIKPIWSELKEITGTDYKTEHK